MATLIRPILHLILIVLVVTLEASLGLWLGDFSPSILLAIILALSLSGDLIDSLWWLVIGGLLIDSLSADHFGFLLVIYTLISTSLIMLNRQLLHHPPIGLASLVFLGYGSIPYLIISFRFGYFDWRWFGAIILTTLIASSAYYWISIIGKKREVIRIEF